MNQIDNIETYKYLASEWLLYLSSLRGISRPSSSLAQKIELINQFSELLQEELDARTNLDSLLTNRRPGRPSNIYRNQLEEYQIILESILDRKVFI